jgi:hypothetical protein
VLKVQELLAACGEHIEAATEEGNAWKAMHQVGKEPVMAEDWPRSVPSIIMCGASLQGNSALLARIMEWFILRLPGCNSQPEPRDTGSKDGDGDWDVEVQG